MGAEPVQATAVNVIILHQQVAYAMGKPQFGRKLEIFIKQIKAKAIFNIYIPVAGAQRVLAAAFDIRAHLNTRLDATEHIHTHVAAPYRFVAGQHRKLNKTRLHGLGFDSAGSRNIFNGPFVIRKGRHQTKIKLRIKPESYNKAQSIPRRPARIDGCNGIKPVDKTIGVPTVQHRQVACNEKTVVNGFIIIIGQVQAV